MFSLRRPSATDLARVTASQADRELTYTEHGATRGSTRDSMPAGYRHDEWDVDLGDFDQSAFERLSAALLDWQIQRRAGITVHPVEPARPGLTFAFWMRLAGVYVTAAGRVVYVTSDADRRGFAYGTLPQHPEQGEEAFHLVKDGSRLVFRVTAFSRPYHPLARLGAPVSRLAQVRMNRAYLRAMRSAASTLHP